MFHFKQLFYNPICFKCGSFFVREHLFCPECYLTEILPRISIKTRIVQHGEITIIHFYLFDWVPGESDLISKLIYQMKSNRCEAAIRYYSKILAIGFLEKGRDENSYNCVLPLPGSTDSSVHANLMADEISTILGVVSEPIFCKNQKMAQQKELSFSSRKSIDVQLVPKRVDELFTKLNGLTPIPIYVDDVFTTGNTLKASMKAFGGQKTSYMLTTFFRPLSLEKSSIARQT